MSLFLLKIFNSWSLVRGLTNFVFFVALLWSYIFVTKPMNLSKRSVYLSSLFLFIPYSLEYLNIVHMGNSYIPHFIMIFVCVGLVVRLINVKSTLLFVLFTIAGLYVGLCGIRFSTFYAIPVLLAAIFKIVIDNYHGKGTLFSLSTLKSKTLLLPVYGLIVYGIGLFVNLFVFPHFITVGRNCISCRSCNLRFPCYYCCISL